MWIAGEVAAPCLSPARAATHPAYQELRVIASARLCTPGPLNLTLPMRTLEHCPLPHRQDLGCTALEARGSQCSAPFTSPTFSEADSIAASCCCRSTTCHCLLVQAHWLAVSGLLGVRHKVQKAGRGLPAYEMHCEIGKMSPRRSRLLCFAAG